MADSVHTINMQVLTNGEVALLQHHLFTDATPIVRSYLTPVWFTKLQKEIWCQLSPRLQEQFNSALHAFRLQWNVLDRLMQAYNVEHEINHDRPREHFYNLDPDDDDLERKVLCDVFTHLTLNNMKGYLRLQDDGCVQFLWYSMCHGKTTLNVMDKELRKMLNSKYYNTLQYAVIHAETRLREFVTNDSICDVSFLRDNETMYKVEFWDFVSHLLIILYHEVNGVN